MQDHILSYMLGDRHIDDTLFIFLEEDYTLFEGKEEPIASMPKLTESQTYFAGGNSWWDVHKGNGSQVRRSEDIAGTLASTTGCSW